MHTAALETSAPKAAAPLTGDFDRHVAELDRTGTVMFPAYELFSADELERLDRLQNQLPEELVTLGDAGEPNDLYVRRIMVDKPGELPRRVNQPVSDEIMALLGDERRTALFQRLLGGPQFIRRCQVNRMVKNSFIGLHLDTDSNPDYLVSVVIQLGRDFDGGEFVVYPEGRPANVLHPTYGTVIVSRCEHRHEVRRVLSNERTSLVYFYSPNDRQNARAS